MKQMTLFDLQAAKESTQNWFQSAMDFFDLRESPGWPDNFGSKFNGWIYTQSKCKIRTISLFSGGGGLDIAFHDIGFDIVESVEIEKKFADTLLLNSTIGKHLSGIKVVCKDIREYTPTEEKIDFIIGGPPCQTFSAAGARASGVNGIDDQRGTLFEEYVRILKHASPKGFLFENVYRIVGAQEGKPWKMIQEAFKSAGYKLFWRILDTADYGVPQHRERLIIVGVRDDAPFLFPSPTHGPDSKGNKPYYNAGMAVKGIDSSKCVIGINGRHGHLLSAIPPGLNYSFYTDRMGHPTPIFGWRSKFSDYLYKADPNTPVRTIKAQGGQYTGPFSWENRPFMLDEFKRLQTFPDNYELSGNRQTAIHQIGNSVPPQMARIMAIAIMNQVFNVNLPFVVQYLKQTDELGFRARKSSLTKIYTDKATESISNTHTVKKGVYQNEAGECRLHLTNQFQLIKQAKENSVEFEFDYDINYDRWTISCYNGQANDTAYSIFIKPSLSLKKIIHSKEIHLTSKDRKHSSILALWKFLELKLSELIHKDDLIQLFGYYQYKQVFNCEFIQVNEELFPKHFWTVASFVTRGVCVGQTLNVKEISSYYGVGTSELIDALKSLKSIGFEVRSNNTNQQIKEDNYLIPYSFPTLNERSLQRLTTL